MDLFSDQVDAHHNYLPYDGVVNYHGIVLTPGDAKVYFDRLLTHIDWRRDEAMMFGKLIVTKRKVAWYGDQPYSYTYSKRTKYALPWTDELMAIKSIVQDLSGETYNSCLLNLYHTGEEGMGWHSDDEAELKENGAIASLSLGAERRFAFKHKSTKETVYFCLEHGSLLVMKGACQKHWLHRLPPTKKVSEPRINLTFRTMER